ncbi:MAG: DNA gyrase subunit A [Parcubacteria group bacterium]|nr:DNA gyrase subunit A [Parcubacteria group bacterium]
MAKKDDSNKKEVAVSTGHVIPRNITTEMKESYLDYAMSVIASRALPDVRDGLKPVHRRILYAMSGLGLSHSARFRKSAAVVGEVLGKYHPHGDTSVYDALVKMAQEFSHRYPLILGQGNFGSVDGDSAAAMRYTEAKMSRLSGELLRDLDKDTVEWRPNYDNTKKEPTVLPAVVPNLLLNGTLGIAVGMATNIPPHNISEVVDATIHLIENEDASTEDLLKFVQGPDFPTGGVAFNAKDIAHAYATGKGGVIVRGEAEIVEGKGGNTHIVITSLPYRVNKAELVIRIASLVRDKKIDGIRGLRDETARGETRIVVDLKSTSHPQKILNYLYKHSDLETTFHYNMLALVDGVPRVLSLKTILKEFIGHREVVVRKRTEFDLKRAEERAHILTGLKKALDHIDKIIKTIKASADTPTAHKNLVKTFKFSDAQAAAILEMKLQKLAGLERKNIELELKEKIQLIAELKALLASQKKIRTVIKNELSEIKKVYGDERRTKIVRGGVKMLSMEDIIPDEETVVVLTKGGYIKRTNPAEYRRQKRGGVGVQDLNTKEEDFITTLLTATTHNDVLFFTNAGKVYQSKMYEIPEGKRATKGKSIMNFLPLAQGEEITSVLALPKVAREIKDLSLCMVTKNGMVKKASAQSFLDVRRSGIIALKLKKGDALLSTMFVEKGDTVVLSSTKGQAIRFKESDVRVMGRAAAGVRGMKLRSGDSVVGADVVRSRFKEPFLLSVSEKGNGKRTPIKEYKVQRRGGSGIKTAKINQKTGPLIVAKVVTEEDEEIVVISKQSQVIRVALKEISSLGRQTQGVRIMRLRDRDSIATFICL